MVDYVVTVQSSHRNTIEIIESVLQCETVSILLFPAELPVAPNRSLLLNSPEDFSVSAVPDAFQNDTVAHVPFYGGNGLEFAATIYLKDTVLPDVCILDFSDEHLAKGIISFQRIRSLLTEVIPAFDADHVLVYRKGLIERRYFRGPKRRYPRELGWFTYFGDDLVDFLGRRRFKRLKDVYEVSEINGGILIALQEEPIGDTPAQLQRLREVQNKLRLNKLP